MQRIIVLDYGMGNLFSVKKKLTQIGVDSLVTNKTEDILSADKIILPGVGHFGKAMENIKNGGILDALNEKVVQQNTPVLGICLGMQLMCRSSEEGNCEGLSWIDAKVKRFSVNDTLRFKVPHTGWSAANPLKESQLLKQIGLDAEFYFVHSYYVECQNQEDQLTSSVFETTFTSAFQRENIFGVQFHPEKSHAVGTQLFQNFIEL